MELKDYLKKRLPKKKRKHSKDVARIMGYATATDRQKKVAMLHDVLEAGRKKEREKLKKEIEEKFGRRVLSSVKNLTTHKKGKKKQKEMVSKMQTMPDEDVEVKLADRISNLHHREITKKYRKKTKQLIKAVEARGSVTKNQEKAIKYIRDLIKKN